MQDKSKPPTITLFPGKRKQPDMSKKDMLQNILQELSEMKTVMRRYRKLCFKYALREKCPNTELFRVRIQENTNQK